MARHGTETLCDEFPVQVVQKMVEPTYIYRLPLENGKCFRFQNMLQKTAHISVVCSQCMSLRKSAAGRGLKTQTTPYRRLLGCSMEMDPCLNHIDGCEPLDYSEVLKKYELLKDEDSEQIQQYEFIVEKAVKTTTHLMLYRLRDEPAKCYGFSFSSIHPVRGISVRCSTCFFIQKKARKGTIQYNLTEDGFVDSPALNHVPGCAPLSYDDLMQNHNPLAPDTARELLQKCFGLGKQFYECNGAWRTQANTQADIQDGQIRPVEHLLGPGIGVIEAKTNITYFYRIPNSNTCLRFTTKTYYKTHMALTCMCCGSKRGGKHATLLKSDGFSMKEDPTLKHGPLCKPDLYSEATKNHRIVDVGDQPPGQYAFPLVRWKRCGPLQLILRLENILNKCYLFINYKSIKCSEYICVVCFTCNSMKLKNINKNRNENDILELGPLTNYRVSASSFFLDDPLTGHYSGCEPLDYEHVMNNSEYVDKKRAANFISGACFTVDEMPRDEHQISEFPAFVIQKKNAVSYVYQLPFMPANGYLFYRLNHTDHSRLFCSTCLGAGEFSPSSDVVIRNSDGDSMETDPTTGHLDHCRGLKMKLIWNGKTNKEDGETNQNRQYQFPLVKRLRREHYLAAYRLKDDPSRCYKFTSHKIARKTGNLVVCCSGCGTVALQNRRQNQSDRGRNPIIATSTYQCNSSGFLEDPTLRHAPNCKPYVFEDLMSEYDIAGKEETSDFFIHRYTDRQTHRVENVKRSKRAVQSKSQADQNDQSDSIPMNVDTIDPMDQKWTAFSNELLDETTMSELSADFAPRGFLSGKPQIFSRTFDVPFFTEDEMSVKTTDRTYILELRRETLSVGVESCYVRYSINLPLFVDITTVQTTWNNYQITVTAQTII